MTDKLTYRKSGVDIDAGNSFVERIKPLIKNTTRREMMSGIGGFGGLFHLDTGKIKDPLLVSSTDGVGTKLKIAQLMDKHDTVGIDLVAMSVNDIIVQGAEPLFFLDYIACGKLDVDKSVQIVEGIVTGCQDAGCSLLGGETAEMPGFYPNGEYDLAGFCVGVVEADKLIDGSEIRVGDRIIGIASSGLHSNGFSLVRRILFDEGKLKPSAKIAGFDQSLGLELLTPTKIYVKPILNLIKNFQIHGIVHITGGGFTENIPRIIPAQCCSVIRRGSWPTLPIFDLLRDIGKIDDEEMFRVFNMGIGMVLIVAKNDEAEIIDRLDKMGEHGYALGEIEMRGKDDRSVYFI
ncbi:MAG: phosphoribosylformylglycinamidine cyclo-ligase [Syntrophales bacterium]|jgi:phosphoribosylformylglycinamidine cyclo-ligase|nr:phosphoribosylformylglycinamidine cyclo-ligase [Syntrophales bacterium]